MDETEEKDYRIIIDNSDLKNDSNEVRLIREDDYKDATAKECGDELQKSSIKYLLSSEEDGKKAFPHSDFFIVRLLIRPRIEQDKKIWTKWIVRKTCPTPTYDQTVFHYKKNDNNLNYLWTIPDDFHAQQMKLNMLHVDPELRQLLEHILDFFDGTLDKLCARLNKEDTLKTNLILEKIDNE